MTTLEKIYTKLQEMQNENNERIENIKNGNSLFSDYSHSLDYYKEVTSLNIENNIIDETLSIITKDENFDRVASICKSIIKEKLGFKLKGDNDYLVIGRLNAYLSIYKTIYKYLRNENNLNAGFSELSFILETHF